MRIISRLVALAGLVFGGAQAIGEVGTLIGIGDSWHFQAGVEEPPPDWRTASFDETQWQHGPSGFSSGFGIYGEATVKPEFSTAAKSLYLRHKFVLTNLTEIFWPVLRIDYDDGFVAYLNETEIARRGLTGAVGEVVPFDAIASPRPREFAEEIDLRPHLDLFEEGTNVFAIQVHKTQSQPVDLTIAVIPELLSGITRGPFLQSTTTNSTLIVLKTAITSAVRVEYGESAELGLVKFGPDTTNHHTVHLGSLKPDTKYFYRVRTAGSGQVFYSETYSFRTLKNEGESRFIVIGDTGVGQKPQYELAELLSARDVDLVLHAGDIVYPQFTVGRVDSKLFGVYREMMTSVPWFFCIGNHDLYSGESHYLNTFHLPENSQFGGQRHYSFDHGDVHFAVLLIPYLNQYKLDSGDSQYHWLTNDLATTSKPWKVMMFHVPMQTSANHRVDDFNLNGIRDSEEIREVLLPIAEQYGVQVTFSGHDHVLERFAPTNGVQTITTGGGGVALYHLVERDAASVQFWSKHHFLDVEVEGDRMEIRAIDLNGTEFDSQVVYRNPPPGTLHTASWNTPIVESFPADDTDGNINGQTYDLIGNPVGALPGQFSSLGEARVNNDKTHLHIGINSALLRDDSVIYLFVESPGLTGVSTMAGVGNGRIDPGEQGADGLDLLENLTFSDFTPAIAVILGDEKSDGSNRAWQRPGQSLATGQGAFRLNAALDEVDATIQQFNRSPQAGGVVMEQNADFIEVSLPNTSLGGLQPEDIVRIGAVIAGDGHDSLAQVQRLDTAFLGTSMTGAGTNSVVLSGVSVQLAPDPDRDGDGLPNDWEVVNNFDPDSSDGVNGALGDIDNDGAGNLHEFMAGTNPRNAQSVFRMWLSPLGSSQMKIHWKTEPGLRYSLESAGGGSVTFLPLDPVYFPRTAAGSEETFTNQTTGNGRLFRVMRVN